MGNSAYFVCTNCTDGSASELLHLYTSIVEKNIDTSWVEQKLIDMREFIEDGTNGTPPQVGTNYNKTKECDKCMYAIKVNQVKYG